MRRWWRSGVIRRQTFSTRGALNGPPARAAPGAALPVRGPVETQLPSHEDPLPASLGGFGASTTAPPSKPTLDKDDPSSHWDRVKEAARESAMQREQKREQEQAAPPIINVPSICSRCVGRDNDLFHLWQRLHQGKRILVLEGVDGVGKSTLAVAFGEHARRSGRFTCVQWIDGRVPVASQLQTFLKDVQGRKEIRVLFIFDDVANPATVLNLIPPSDAFCAVITTTTTNDGQRFNPSTASYMTNFVHVHQVTSPALEACAELITDALVGGGSASAIGGRLQSDNNGEYELAPNEPPSVLQQGRQSLSPRSLNSVQVNNGIPTERGPEESVLDLAATIAERLGCIPLLCHIAGCYLHQSGKTASTLIGELDAIEPLQDGALSVSRTLRALLQLAVEQIQRSLTAVDVTAVLEKLAMVNTEDLNPGLLHALHGDDAIRVLDSAINFGLAYAQWNRDAVGLQPLVAKELRTSLVRDLGRTTAVVNETATKLLGMWPRRWRGMGADRAWSLARHTAALHDHVVAAQIPMSLDMMAAADRAATFMAHISGRDLERAGELWLHLAQTYLKQNNRGSECARVALDATRILYLSGDYRAKETAELAHQLAIDAHGARALQPALAVMYRVRYLPFTQQSLEMVVAAADILQATLSGAAARSEDDVLSPEMTHMVKEAVFVLRLGAAKISEGMGREIGSDEWAKLEKLHADLKDSEAVKNAERQRDLRKAKEEGNAFDLDRA
jgi:hypothetical protein